MQKTTTAIVAAASLAATVIAAPKPAEARCIGCWVGAGIAAAVIGGVFASRAYGYGYGYPATVRRLRRLRRLRIPRLQLWLWLSGVQLRVRISGVAAMPTRRSCTARTTRRAATMPAGTIATDPCRRRDQVGAASSLARASGACRPRRSAGAGDG